MEKIQKAAIVALADEIAENLSLTEVLVKLYARGWLTKPELDKIKHPTLIDHERNQALLEKLQQKAGSFYDFLEILIATGQPWIAESINEKYKDLKGEKPMDVKETKKVLDRLGWKQEASAVRYVINYIPKTDNTTENEEADYSETNVQQSRVPAAVHLQANRPDTSADEEKPDRT